MTSGQAGASRQGHDGPDRRDGRDARVATSLHVAGVAFEGDPAGALYWPEQGLLAVAELHLEKGSSFAARGVLLPPYDTAATLARLARLIAHGPSRVPARFVVPISIGMPATT